MSNENATGWVVEHYTDAGPIGKVISPQLREVLELLASGQADGLVVAKLGQLSRPIINAANIIEALSGPGPLGLWCEYCR